MKRVWVDANVLLRLLTADPPDLAERALSLVKRAESGKLHLRVTTVVAAEVVWVLGSFYRLPKQEIANLLAPLLAAPGFEVEHRDEVIAALVIMADANVDFSDALLAELARASSEPVASLDDDFARLPCHRHTF